MLINNKTGNGLSGCLTTKSMPIPPTVTYELTPPLEAKQEARQKLESLDSIWLLISPFEIPLEKRVAWLEAGIDTNKLAWKSSPEEWQGGIPTDCKHVPFGAGSREVCSGRTVGIVSTRVKSLKGIQAQSKYDYFSKTIFENHSKNLLALGISQAASFDEIVYAADWYLGDTILDNRDLLGTFYFLLSLPHHPADKLSVAAYMDYRGTFDFKGQPDRANTKEFRVNAYQIQRQVFELNEKRIPLSSIDSDLRDFYRAFYLADGQGMVDVLIRVSKQSRWIIGKHVIKTSYDVIDRSIQLESVK